MVASQRAHLDVVAVLLQYGADANVQDEVGVDGTVSWLCSVTSGDACRRGARL